MTKNIPWWKKINTSVALDGPPDAWFIRGIFSDIIENSKPLYRLDLNGYVEDEGKLAIELVKKHVPQARLSIVDVDPNGFDRRFYVWEGGVIELSEYDTGVINFEIKTTVPEVLFALLKELKDYLKEKVPQGIVKMLVQTSGGYGLTDIGSINSPLNRENYSEEICKGYDHLIEESTIEKPCGRFSILAGMPGTGKSYFVRGLITEGSGRYIYIPASLVGGLSGPSLVRVLCDSHAYEESQATTLIIEDADSSIAKRSGANLNQLSDLLNISDGLLGEIADIRVLATTNAKLPELDDAIVRPGRLCSLLNFESLTVEHYKKLYKRETDVDLKVWPSKDKERTLASLYHDISNSSRVKMDTAKEDSGQYV